MLHRRLLVQRVNKACLIISIARRGDHPSFCLEEKNLRQVELFLAKEISGSEILLDEEESHHCIKVMRHKAGDELLVTDGQGKMYSCRLEVPDKNHCMLELIETVKEEAEPLPFIHLAIAPTKSIDRFEWFLEKAAEIGVSEITPIITERSERDKIRHDRLYKIVLAAMKQSLRLWLPKLNSSSKFNEIVNRKSPMVNQNFIAHCQSQNLPLLKSLYQPKHSVLILVGPEGDFTRDEVTLAEDNGFVSVSLSKARLRTETAGMVALHTVQLLND